jgi:hypothetical protein
MTIKLANVVVETSWLPELKVYRSPGAATYKVILEVYSAFTAAQITACITNSTASIKHDVSNGYVTYTGTVTGFGTRLGYSIVQLSNCTCTYSAT